MEAKIKRKYQVILHSDKMWPFVDRWCRALAKGKIASNKLNGVYEKGTKGYRPPEKDENIQYWGYVGEMLTQLYCIENDVDAEFVALLDDKPVMESDLVMGGVNVDCKSGPLTYTDKSGNTRKSFRLQVSKDSYENPANNTQEYHFMKIDVSMRICDVYVVDASELKNWPDAQAYSHYIWADITPYDMERECDATPFVVADSSAMDELYD